MTKNKRIILTILLIIALILTSDLVFIYFKENFISGADPSFYSIILFQVENFIQDFLKYFAYLFSLIQ